MSYVRSVSVWPDNGKYQWKLRYTNVYKGIQSPAKTMENITNTNTYIWHSIKIGVWIFSIISSQGASLSTRHLSYGIRLNDYLTYNDVIINYLYRKYPNNQLFRIKAYKSGSSLFMYTIPSPHQNLGSS